MDPINRIIMAEDWISPACGLIESAWRGELGCTFQFEDMTDCDWAITKLRGVGIETWAHGYDAESDAWCFNVSNDNYRRACKVLGI